MFLLLVTLVAHTVNTLLVYDCQTLLNLRLSDKILGNFDYYGQRTLPPFLSDFLTYLCCTPVPPPQRKWHHRRGKHSGCLVRLKAGLVRPDRGGYGAGPCIWISQRSLDLVATCLVPVAGSDVMFQPRGPCSPCLHWGGVNLGYMRPLCWASPSAVCPDTPASSRVGLVNARSLTNKSFILKDFFVSRELYFLFFSETWLRIFESSVFTKLLPDKCCFFNSPQMSGRREGIATLNVNSYCCHPPSPALNSSCLSWGILTWCCVLWSSGLLNITDFLTDFSVFLADIMPKYDQILIVGDCNIHVCCPCMLFKVINSVLNAPLTGTETSTAVCENVLHYFIDKVTSTRALIPPPASDPSVFVPHSVGSSLSL